MNVLHLAAGNLFGGVESYLLTLARLRQLAPEMEPHFGLCFPGRLRDELTAAALPVRDLGAVRLSRPWTVLRARRRLGATLREFGTGAVVTHGLWTQAVFGPTVKRKGIRLINAVHGEVSARRWLDRWAARTRPDAVMANSRFTAAGASAIFPGVRVETVHPPLAASATFDRAATRFRIRAELDTAADAAVILIVSRIEALKGHAVLIDALAQLRQVAGWVCWIVGGAQRPHERELLAGLRSAASRAGIGDRVRFAGARPDIPGVMAAADIYCQPNIGPEGFGLTFVEALRAGLPVITSDFGGAAEIVDPSCGRLVPPGDAGAVADALRKLIESPDLRGTLGGVGPARATALCDPAARLADLVRIARP